MDIDGSFQELPDGIQPDQSLPRDVLGFLEALDGEGEDGDDDDVEDGEFEFGADYADDGDEAEDDDEDLPGSQGSQPSTSTNRSDRSTPPNRSRTSSPKRASPARDSRSIPSVSLLYAPKRDARAVRSDRSDDRIRSHFSLMVSSSQILGRQYFETPLATFREAHSEVFIVTKKEKSRGDEFKTFAVKRQHLADPDNLTDKAYRELRILMQLRRLRELRMCENFVFLRDWIKSVPPLMFPVSGVYKPDAQVRCFFVRNHIVVSSLTALSSLFILN